MNYVIEGGKIWQKIQNEISVQELRNLINQRKAELLNGDNQIEQIKARKLVVQAEIVTLEDILDQVVVDEE